MFDDESKIEMDSLPFGKEFALTQRKNTPQTKVTPKDGFLCPTFRGQCIGCLLDFILF